MEQTRFLFLQIVKASLEGRKAELPQRVSQEQWEEIFRLAREQRLLPLCYEGVYDSPVFRETAGALAPGLKWEVTQQVVLQASKTAAFLQLYQAWNRRGVHPLVVKGILCRSLYPRPDDRPSGDEDLLVLPGEEPVCLEVLEEFGMIPLKNPGEEASELPYRQKAGSLYLELHRTLFPPESEAYGDLNCLFQGVEQRKRTQFIQGVPVDTLGHTDHLLYLICHSLKHFLHSGFGIRQICDLVMYANRYGSQIDWEQVRRGCQAMGGEKFALAMFRIGAKHLGFDPEQACFPKSWWDCPVEEGPMLDDLLSGGVYGGATMSRRHSSRLTLEAVAAQKGGRRKKMALHTSLFPSGKDLKGRYPYLERFPWLLPVAWGQRLWHYARESEGKASRASEAMKIGEERIALLERYDLLK